MNKILVLNGPSYKEAVKGCGEITCDLQDFMAFPDQYKLVLFTGGADVNPAVYGHTSPKKLCHYDNSRDMTEKRVFDLATRYDIPMAGICRGAQFLNVMSGGTLFHHITGHASEQHDMLTSDGEEFNVTSSHHQMCIVSAEGYVIGTAKTNKSTVYCGDKDLKIDYKGKEVEAIYYPKTKVFAVQYHPEWMSPNSDGFMWFQKGILDILTLTPEQFIKEYSLNKKTMSANA